MSYFGPIMIQDVTTKFGPYGDILGMLCGGWDSGSWIEHSIEQLVFDTHVGRKNPFSYDYD